VGLLYVLAPRPIIAMFKPRDGDTTALFAAGGTMLMMSSIWQLFDGLGMTLSEALRAAGDTSFCMWARMVLAWVVFTPLAWTAVLLLGGGIVTMMIALIVYIALIAVVMGARFASGRWRAIQLVEDELHAPYENLGATRSGRRAR
jgi:multidrug resistance protein, MATE family